MALTRDTQYPGRFDSATPQQPQGAFKNRTTDTSKDGSYLEKEWLNDWSAFFSSILNNAGVTPNGLTDEVGASQYFSAMLSTIEVEPLGNKNAYFRQSMVKSPDAAVTFPPTSVGENYTAGTEIVWGLWAGASGTSGVIVTDNDGITWISDSIELRYTLENTALFNSGDETVYILDDSGESHWLKVAEVAALSSSVTTNVLTVDIDFAIFAELGISSIRQLCLQDKQGVLREKNAEEVMIDTTGLLDFHLDENGYKIFPNGEIEQWGRRYGGTLGIDNASFPISFPNEVYWGSAAMVATTTPDQLLALHVTDYTTSTITVSKLFVNDGGAVGDALQGWSYSVKGR